MFPSNTSLCRKKYMYYSLVQLSCCGFSTLLAFLALVWIGKNVAIRFLWNTHQILHFFSIKDFLKKNTYMKPFFCTSFIETTSKPSIILKNASKQVNHWNNVKKSNPLKRSCNFHFLLIMYTLKQICM